MTSAYAVHKPVLKPCTPSRKAEHEPGVPANSCSVLLGQMRLICVYSFTRTDPSAMTATPRGIHSCRACALVPSRFLSQPVPPITEPQISYWGCTPARFAR